MSSGQLERRAAGTTDGVSYDHGWAMTWRNQTLMSSKLMLVQLMPSQLMLSQMILSQLMPSRLLLTLATDLVHVMRSNIDASCYCDYNCHDRMGWDLRHRDCCPA